MKLKSILAGLENLKAKGEIELDIPNIENDSRKVQPGDMFIAIKGFETDGHNYIKDAVDNGAKVIVIQEIDAKDNEKFLTTLFAASLKYLFILLKNFIILTSFIILNYLTLV